MHYRTDRVLGATSGTLLKLATARAVASHTSRSLSRREVMCPTGRSSPPELELQQRPALAVCWDAPLLTGQMSAQHSAKKDCMEFARHCCSCAVHLRACLSPSFACQRTMARGCAHMTAARSRSLSLSCSLAQVLGQAYRTVADPAARSRATGSWVRALPRKTRIHIRSCSIPGEERICRGVTPRFQTNLSAH